MNTKFTNDEWLLIFQQRNQSGLSVRKWCDSNQISYDKYKYWEKKLLRKTDSESRVSPMDFVELPQTLFPPLSPAQEQSYPFERKRLIKQRIYKISQFLYNNDKNCEIVLLWLRDASISLYIAPEQLAMTSSSHGASFPSAVSVILVPGRCSNR